MSTLTFIRFTERETDAFPARTVDKRLDGGMVERLLKEHMDILPRVGDEMVVSFRCCFSGEPTRTWYGRQKPTYVESFRIVTLRLDKVVHDLDVGVIQLGCTFVSEKT